MSDEYYMQLALEEARRAARRGEVPIGAVVVQSPCDCTTGQSLALPHIIAKAGNAREEYCNPAGHAEFLAIMQAAKDLSTWRLSDCEVYVTLEPCVMCAGLMHQARIRRCIFGASDPKAGALGSLYEIHADPRLNHNFAVSSGIMQEECAAILRSFFRNKRRRQKEKV